MEVVDNSLEQNKTFEVGESGVLSLKEYFENLLKVNINNLEQYYQLVKEHTGKVLLQQFLQELLDFY